MRAALVLLTSTIFFSFPLLQYHFTHPGYNPVYFIAGMLILVCALIAVVAGLSATPQNYRASPQTCLLVPLGGLRHPG